MKWLQMLEARWQAWWPELEMREQRIIIAASVLAIAALAWWIAVAPALRTLGSAPAEHALLDAQLQQMSQLQKQAKALQSQPRASRDDAVRGLEASVRQTLGSNAQIQPGVAGEGMTVGLRAVPADALAQWLAQARSNAHAVPREAHLTRSTQSGAAGSPASPRAASAPEVARVRWDGTLVMGLPAR